MTRIKLIMLSMVAVLGVSAVASTSAFALETRWTVEGTTVTTETPVEGVVGTAQLNSIILGQKIIIECTENTLSNAAIEKEGKSKGEIKFKKCTVVTVAGGVRGALPKCVVKEPIEFKFLDLLVAGPGGVLEDEFKPSTGEEFVTIHIENKGEEICTLRGVYEATGTYDASGGAEVEVSKTEHELVYTSTGSKVKLKKELAAFTNKTTLKLVSGKPFYAG